jgi:hypothetical protein
MPAGGPYTRPVSWLVKRRLRAVGERLARAREELAVAEAQVEALSDEADYGAMDFVFRDDAVDRAAGRDAVRHAERQSAALVRLRGEIDELRRRQDELLDQMGSGS